MNIESKTILITGANRGREPVVIILQRGADTWTAYSAIRMNVIGPKIVRIADYIHCPWMIPAAASVFTAGPT